MCHLRIYTINNSSLVYTTIRPACSVHASAVHRQLRAKERGSKQIYNPPRAEHQDQDNNGHQYERTPLRLLCFISSIEHPSVDKFPDYVYKNNRKKKRDKVVNELEKKLNKLGKGGRGRHTRRLAHKRVNEVFEDACYSSCTKDKYRANNRVEERALCFLERTGVAAGTDKFKAGKHDEKDNNR